MGRSDSRTTLEQYLREWLSRPSKRSAMTQSSYATKLRLYVYPHIGALPLATLTRKDIQGLYNRLASAHVGMRAIRLTHSALHRALEDALLEEKIEYNPAHRACRYEYEAPTPKGWTPERLKQFEDALSSDTDWMSPFYYLSLMTGCQRNELCALTWDKVHLDAAPLPFFLVDQAAQELAGGVRREPLRIKGHERRVPLTPGAVQALIQLQGRQALMRKHHGASFNKENLVFTDAAGDLLRPSKVTSYWPILRERLGLPEVQLRYLRHPEAPALQAALAYPPEGGDPKKRLLQVLNELADGVSVPTRKHA